MKFAQWTYRIAGLLGLLETVPALWGENAFGRDYPPAINHPVFYYGFLVVVICWQLAFLIISTDPVRYRPLMWATFFDKFGYVLAVAILYTQQRLAGPFLVFAAIDFIAGVAFVIAYLLTSKEAAAFRTPGRSPTGNR
ncbi:MAG TPA: hypothetical protein DF383_01165 [Deltaproteobacteria bacterium]|nr:hypothetical protein [Deltaproteobacteria bacterium]